uniref:Reverse transcriptase domain-containing protein n=1 Tax=Lactuca sativa TaxID=4236 RepID=A0A9R1URI3_LACSA|nr:hypothetical protein LSAT_V11C800406980 [Lactuca sativa]
MEDLGRSPWQLDIRPLGKPMAYQTPWEPVSVVYQTMGGAHGILDYVGYALRNSLSINLQFVGCFSRYTPHLIVAVVCKRKEERPDWSCSSVLPNTNHHDHKPRQGTEMVCTIMVCGQLNHNDLRLRYAGVIDTHGMELKMNGVRFRGVTLLANLAKYQKERSNRMQISSRKPNVLDAAPKFNFISRDSRTFAQVAAGVNVAHQGNSPPIVLNAKTAMSEWTKKTLLIGEALSLDHIANLPEHTFTYENTKYLGGLKLGIKFGSSKEAREFLEDRSRWHEWFKWLTMDMNTDVQYERLAWLKITGVPLRYWDTDNFSKIASKFGKVIIPFESLYDRKDLSMGKVGVITSSKNWINEVVRINVDGTVYGVGVVENTEDWSPFKSCQFEKMEDGSEFEGCNNDNEDDGVSETWIPEEDNDLEEGEFRCEDEPETWMNKTNKHAEFGNPPANVENPKDATVGLNDVIPHEEVNVGCLNESVGMPHVLKDIQTSVFEAGRIRSDPGDVGLDSDTKDIGLMDNSSPIRSSSPAPNNSKTSNSNSNLSSYSKHCCSEPKSKRRKRRRGSRSPINGDASSRVNCPTQNSQDPKSPNGDVQLDLNKEPLLSGSSEGSGETLSNEIIQTVAIGAEIGFQMGVDNPILNEVVGGVKTGWVRRLKKQHKANFIGLQETQISTSSRIDVNGCWDSNEFDYESVDASGRSGGIISIWDISVFQRTDVIKNRHYLVVSGKYTGSPENVILNIVNIYGPQSIRIRRRFIQDANLKDYNMGGERFTYISRVDAKLSKLDRFLTCPNYLQMFPLSHVTAHPREISDHSPITLLSSEADFGPIPFKLFNSWLYKEGFDQLVSDAWYCFRGFGTPDAYLAAKFRFLKDKIKKWRNEGDQIERQEVNVAKDVVKEIEKAAESRSLSSNEQRIRADVIKKIMEWERLQALDLKQKARIKWTIDGDENSKFFHGYINSKNRRNLLHGLMINGRWTTGVNEIKEEAYRFFHDKFTDAHPVRPKFSNPNFKSISMMDAIRIESPFSPEEVKAAVWDCGCEKAPGPDDFTFKFMKKFWGTIKEDVMKFVTHFEESGSFARGCNSSFITLAPKIKDPLCLNDYRPISLIGCLSKIISKLLSNRLKSVIGNLIGDMQSAYVEGRCILEGPLMVNEVCSWAKRAHKKILLFKVDFDKAFDSVNWKYLESTMEQMGFGNKWRSWIRGCLNSSWASVIINGSPTKEFPMSKGVCQGDPLSPYLFIIAMEGLSVAIRTACDKGIFKGVQIPGNGPILSHLFYADDALFIGEWSRANLKNLARILRCDLPFDYLGVPVGANMNLKKHWKPIIKKFQSKLSLWKAKSLLFGGRLTLIKSVLGNLPTYFLSLFRAPVGVIEELEKIRRSFLWGGGEDKKKIHWVSWDKVLAANEAGGLGVGSIQALNIGLLVKWWWRLNNESKSLWARVITGIHNLANKPIDYLSARRYVGVWNNIASSRKFLCGLGIRIHDLFNIKIMSGNNTLFWYDHWIGSSNLKTRYPNLFELESKKRCTVVDMIGDRNQNWKWKSRPSA